MRATMLCLALILAGEAVFLLVKGRPEPSAAPTVQPLKVEGTALTAGGQPVAMHGVSLGWHNIWPRFYNADAVRTLCRDWNARIIRAAIGADSHAAADNPGIHSGYCEEPSFALDKLYAVVDAAIEYGAYVIVDWHSHVIHTREAAAFFSAVATRYKGVPNVIYELFNEPVCPSFETERSYADLGDEQKMNSYWQELKAYAHTLIEAITSVDDSNPLILMGCPAWDQRIDLAASDPVEGYPNLMYTVHFYAGTHGGWLRDRTEAAVRSGLPVLISECAGCNADGDGPIDAQAWKEWSGWADSLGISMLAWSISDKAETCSMITPQGSDGGPWTDEDVKEWGRIVKDWVK